MMMMMMMMMKQKKLVDDTDCFWFGIGDRDVVRLMSSMEYEDEVVEVGGIAYYTSSLFIMVLCSFGVWIVVRGRSRPIPFLHSTDVNL